MNSLGNKKIMADNIKKYMDAKHKTRQDLCRDLGFAYSTLTDWINAVKYPRIDKIEQMANYFGVTKSDLVELHLSASFDIERKLIPNAKNITPFTPSRVPLVGRIAAGTPILAEQNIDGYENLANGVQADFCLQVQGDSMVGANIHNGDIVFIRQQEEVEEGEIAAVLIDDSATLKRFYRHEDAIELRPENPKYRSMYFTANNCDSFHILGKAVALQTLIE